MDEKTVKRLELEIEELNSVEGSMDQDTVDGFRSFVKKQLEKLCGKFGHESPTASARHTRNDSSMNDFQENRTAFVSSETKHKGQGDYYSEDRYDFTHANRGLAVIINNEDFSLSTNFGSRPGSSYDEVALFHTFTHLGFKVLVKKNLTARQMVEVLKLVKDDYDHANADCFVCAVLTHGDEAIMMTANEKTGSRVRHDLLFGVDGKSVATKTVVELFSDRFCPGLQGKPRLFFLQACRGNKYDHGTDILVSRSAFVPGIVQPKGSDKLDHGSCVDQTDSRPVGHQASFSSSVDPPEYHRLSDSTDAKPAGNETGAEAISNQTRVYKTEVSWTPVRDVPISPTPLYKDCLVMYATPPGHFAWRRKNGAWFVQSLCKVLNNPKIGSISLLKALVHVSYCVAVTYQSENPARSDMHHKKETPVIESMLVKDVFFIKKRMH